MAAAGVVVVGAGIVGATAAWQLARRGVDVVLVESEEPGRATSAGAGIVQPWRPAATGPWARYSDLAGATYPQLAGQLAEDSGRDPSYATVGGLTVSRDVTALRAMAAELEAARTARGWTGLGPVELLEPGRAAERFPVLDEGFGAVWSAGAGRVDGRLFRDAAVAAVERAGAVRLTGRAELVADAGRVRGVRVAGEQLDAEAVVLAAGAWTTALCAPLGLALDLAPMRGQIVHLQLPDDGTADWPTVMTLAEEHGHHYLLAFPGGRVVVGATREPDAGFDHRVTAAGQRQVLDAALTLAPGLAAATVLETRVGFRPVTPDGFPLLGAVPGWDGLVLATGLGANGLTYGPLMGVLAAGLALGEPAPFDLTPFAPTR
ncbi:D-amino-acid dehydrogenase [Modestobacter versicolor]|uniref:D-amino-acid dehydrogenase n=3 Tax=Modestobacter versicolor TaxID=429133 RepID=A0A839Y427_9ACTN|nr:FAD-dependent oxidoreductase [Modestobacter versicolor]MBB3677505.1 D-amino-acid dehydrogenase [Modestobacter versicolor]